MKREPTYVGIDVAKTGWISPYVQQVRAGARPTRKRRWRYWLPGCRYWSQPG